MSTKEQTQKYEKAISKQRPSQQTTRNFGSFAHRGDTSSIVQRAQQDSRSLDVQEVRHLQSTIGNQTALRMPKSEDQNAFLLAPFRQISN